MKHTISTLCLAYPVIHLIGMYTNTKIIRYERNYNCVIFSSRGNLYKYLPYSRNLLISTVNKNKDKFVHKGRENITNFLEKLPKTKHDHGSFRIDVPLADVSVQF